MKKIIMTIAIIWGLGMNTFAQRSSHGPNLPIFGQSVDFECTASLDNSLTVGWNWWSTYLDITLADLEAALGSNGVSIVSQEGIVSYYEGLGWDGSFNTLSPSKMYRLQVESDCSLELSGNAVNPAYHTITLAPGINWIGFPVSQSMLISDALQGFTPTIGDVIKTFNGMTTFIGSGWMGTFNTLDPGKGYIYYSNANEVKTFVFTSGR